MFVRVHSTKEIQGGNRSSCINLASYLSKEGDSFFTHNEGEVCDLLQVVSSIDNNRQKLSSTDAKFYMLSINPSHEELCHLLGREVEYNEDLTEADKHLLTDQLQSYARDCMDEYAKNFGRESINSGADLLYFGKVETERHYQFTDRDVQYGEAKINDLKDGLNWHVHIIVSRKSKDGKVKLSPNVISRGNEWVNGEGREMKRGFDHLRWKNNCGDRFSERYNYLRSRMEVAPQVKTKKELALEMIENKEFRSVLEQYHPSLKSIDDAMKSNGWWVTWKNGERIYCKGNNQIRMQNANLKAFCEPPTEEIINSIISRLQPIEVIGGWKCVGDGLTVSRLDVREADKSEEPEGRSAFDSQVSNEKKHFLLIKDEQTGVYISLGKLAKHIQGVDLNRQLELLQNSDLRGGMLNSFSVNHLKSKMEEMGYGCKEERDDGVLQFEKEGSKEIAVRKDALLSYYSRSKKMKSLCQEKVFDEKQLMSTITNKDLRECLENNKKIHLVIEDMKERGYEVVKGNKLCFEHKDGRCAVMFWNDIKMLYAKDKGTELKDVQSIIERFSPFEINEDRHSLGEGLKLKERHFIKNGNAGTYQSIYDQVTKTELPFGSLMKKHRGLVVNSVIEHTKNTDFREALINSRRTDQVIKHMETAGYVCEEKGEESYVFTKGEEQVEVRKYALLANFSVVNKMKTVLDEMQEGNVKLIKESIFNKDLKESLERSTTGKNLVSEMKRRGYKLHQGTRRCYFEGNDGRCAVMFWNDLKQLYPSSAAYFDKFAYRAKSIRREKYTAGKSVLKELKGRTKRANAKTLVQQNLRSATQSDKLDEVITTERIVSKGMQVAKAIVSPKAALKRVVLESIKDIVTVKDL